MWYGSVEGMSGFLVLVNTNVYFCCFSCSGLISALSVAVYLRDFPNGSVWEAFVPPWFLAWLAGTRSAVVTGAIEAAGWELVPTSLVQAACIAQPFRKRRKCPCFGLFLRAWKIFRWIPWVSFCLFVVCFRNRFERWCSFGWLLHSAGFSGLSNAWVKQMLSSLHHCKSVQPPVGLDPKCSFDLLLPVIERLKEHFCSHQMLSGRVTAGSRDWSLLFQEVFLYRCKRCLQN